MLGRRGPPPRAKVDPLGQRRSIASILGQSPLSNSNKVIFRPHVGSNPAAKASTKQALPPLTNGTFHMNTLIHSPIKKMQRKNSGASCIPDLIKSLEHNSIEFQIELKPVHISDSVRMSPANNSAICGHLDDLLRALSEPDAVNSLDEQTTEALLLLVQRMVLREIPEIPKQYLLGEIYAPLSVSCWDQLRVYHKIMLIIVKSLPKEKLMRWIDNEFLRKLAGLFNSPDPEEQNSADTILICLFEQLPQQRNAIFKAILGVVNLYLDRLRPFVVVTPSLRFFVKYFNTIATGWNPQFNATFRNVFVRLFRTDMVKEFYQTLSELCGVFYKYDSEAPECAFKYLLRHWPLTNTSKQEIFLHHMTVVVPHLKIESQGEEVDHLFAIIQASILSPNFRVCEAALKVIGESTFLCLFSESFGRVIPGLCSAVAKVTTHWNPDIEKRAKDVLDVVTSINPENDNGEEMKPQEKDTKSIWASLYQAHHQELEG